MSYLFIVSMDVDPAKEDLFNKVYDNEHIPYLMEVPGVRGVRRAKAQEFAIRVGGEHKALPASSPTYTAIYEIDDPAVLTSDAWAEAVERGRWPGEVRPHTSNRHHALFRMM